ncbi:Bestrophin, RFP-TM, chloride channel-domain-containing protein [Panaeolus papilionaceus]|nr:Bestrophin, RFP-TM, chloride channel-domain-containing protein [Panaeolus papilionaceus]
MSHPDPISPLSRAESFAHNGFRVPDPFAPRQRPGASFVNALLATALFRCWHLLVFFGAWSTLITVLNEQGHKLRVSNILLTVVGTVLGFIISYRTTSSFERYNEGRRLWSQIIFASRTLARTIWFHVPDEAPVNGETKENASARSMIERKSAINLLEAYAVAVKHYLRGEDGIYYKDLYYLVKFLPAYALPAGMPSQVDLHAAPTNTTYPPSVNSDVEKGISSSIEERITEIPATPTSGQPNGPNSITSPTSPGKQSIQFATSPITRRSNGSNTLLPAPATATSPSTQNRPRRLSLSLIHSNLSAKTVKSPVFGKEKERMILPRHDEAYLMEAHMPPKYGLFDIFPFSLFIKFFTSRGKELKGKKAARLRAKMRNQAISHNLPLELSLYLSSYVASLQQRKIGDVPTTNLLLASLNQLVDSLTGLERILTTPIPFSYSIHLWVVTLLYCLALPFQIWTSLGWITIPATTALSFVFFGFLVAGEEIENPFGYDKNDLNLDHFTHNIIRNELRAVTSTPPPDPRRWAFVPENNLLFSQHLDERVSPDEWLARGPKAMQKNLGRF